jgi:hypothetical protein
MKRDTDYNSSKSGSQSGDCVGDLISWGEDELSNDADW